MGDDLPDLPVLQAVGLPCAPGSVNESVIEAALFVTTRSGGSGAVREICELILKVCMRNNLDGERRK